jgi:hypothetical protein
MSADGDRAPTALLERVMTPGRSPADRPSVPDVRSGVGTSTTRYALLATLTTALAILLRSGYSFGLFDQTVYSLRGIALADPNAFAHDWFARSVPQPHWLFDAVTYVGSRFGILPGVYLVYWLAGIAIFALASVWLVDRFLPGRRAFSLALGPLVAVGPTVVLGSTTPLLWFADPHMLGGCLAFLALAGILSGHWRSAAVAAVAAEAVHVQHGANLAPVLLLAAVLCRAAPRRQRALLAGTAVVLFAGAPLIAQWRGLQTGGEEWLTTCRDIIPLHCYAPAWPAAYLGSGAFVLLLAFALAWWGRRHWRVTVPAVVLPAAGLLVGVIGERFQLGIVGRLAEQYNIHRLATFVEPMAALALLCLIARITSLGRRRPVGVMVSLVALIAWVSIVDGVGHGPLTPGAAAAFALTVALLGFTVSLPDGQILREPDSGRFRRPAVALVAGTVSLVLAGAPAGALGHIGYDRSFDAVQTALTLRHLLPRDAVIAAPPETFWLRALSQRSVIADCKAVPYGGPPWHEYMSRIQALGGLCHRSGSGFRDLSPADVEALRTRYGATHALLFTDDPKMAYARRHWTQVYETPTPHDGAFPRGIAVFDLTEPR